MGFAAQRNFVERSDATAETCMHKSFGDKKYSKT